MKKIIGLVGVVSVLVLGSYAVTGMMTERTLKRQFDKMNQLRGVVLKVNEYDRGLFKSYANIDWHVQVPRQDAVGTFEEVVVNLPLVINHGPIIFSSSGVRFGLGYASTTLSMPAQYQASFDENFTPDSDKPKLDLHALVTFMNQMRMEANVPAFTLKRKEGGEFKWEGLTSKLSVRDHAQTLKGKGVLTGFVFTHEKDAIHLRTLKSDYALKESKPNLYTGRIALSLASVDAIKDQTPLFSLENFDVESHTDVTDNLFNATLKASLKKMVSGGKLFGPGDVTLSVEHLDADALASIRQRLAAAGQTDEAKRQASIDVLAKLPALLSHGAILEVSKLSFTMPQGVITGNLRLALPSKSSAVNPFDRFQKMDGEGNISVPVEVVKLTLMTSHFQVLSQSLVSVPATPAVAPTSTTETPAAPVTPPTLAEVQQKAQSLADAELAAMLKSGLIVESNGYYTLSAKLKQGALEVNGKPFTMEMLKF